MSDEKDTIDVPVLEIEFGSLLNICRKINIVDCITVFSMPEHLSQYADKEQMPISDLVLKLIDYQKEENKWRLKEHKVMEIDASDNSIKVLDKMILDAYRIIIISKMNSVFIIPGEESIKNGNCAPNEIIKLSNLISSQLFLLTFNDVKNENGDGYDLKINYKIINRTSIES